MPAPEPPLSVRMLDASHVSAVRSLWRDAFQASADRNADLDQPTAFSRKAFGVGVFDGNELLSFALALPARGDDGRSGINVPGLAHISIVATSPQRWGQGLALHALRAIRWQAMRRGYARCQLWVRGGNARAEALYRRDGFVASGRVQAHSDGDMVHLIRDLTSPPAIIRPAARIVCHDRAERVLLMRWRNPTDGHRFWEPPGGGLEPGESPADGARREWNEETGLESPPLLGSTTVSRDELWADHRLLASETFFLARVDDEAPAIQPSAFTALEQAAYLGSAWLARDDVAMMAYDGDPITPDLMPVLARLYVAN